MMPKCAHGPIYRLKHGPKEEEDLHPECKSTMKRPPGPESSILCAAS